MKTRLLLRRSLLALAAFYLVWSFWYIEGRSGSATHAIAALVPALAVGLGVGFFASSFRIKDLFLRSFSPGGLRVGRAEEFPDLQRDELELLTRQWQDLGFEPCGDRAGNLDNRGAGMTFSRIFEHRAQGAVAEISQIITPTRALPFTASVASFWGERAPVLQLAQSLPRAPAPAPLAAPPSAPVESAVALPDEMEIWMLVTHNRPANKFWPLMRQRRIVSRRLPPDATPATLWQAHLEQRASVEARLQLPHLRGDLAQLLEAHGQVLSAQLHVRLRKTPAWKFGVAQFSRANAPANYDGELAPRSNST